MKPRPIIFSSEMVRAILADKKTQTRRVVKAYPNCHIEIVEGVAEMVNTESPEARIFLNHSPYGVVGDRLWVRETWAFDDITQKVSSENSTIFKADFLDNAKDQRWRSAMFMPRAASRIDLEITSIRVERLQDISEADAIAEGVNGDHVYGAVKTIENAKDMPYSSYVGGYWYLWDLINGKKHPWDSNPWVWVIEFKRVERPL